MFIQRQLTNSIQRLISKFPIVAVTGPRQSGKTTLLKYLFPDYQYISLENPEIRERAFTDPNSFLKSYSNRVILDEVQQVPFLFSYLQTKVDNDQLMGQYILSGSQNFQLLQNITQSLAGRVALFQLLPFSFEELTSAHQLPDSWHFSAFKGYYPAIYNRDIEPTDYYRNYVETYIEKDVRQLINVKDLRQFRLFLKYCAGHAGQMLNLQKLANEVGISQPTAQAWLSVLETSFLVFTLAPFYQNFNKRVVKTPKLYFYDTGLVCYLLEMTKPVDLETYYQRGAIFENLIIAELFKKQQHSYKNQALYFWRDNNQLEVDLLFEKQNQFHLAEIKSAETITPSHFTNLKKIANLMSESQVFSCLIYGGNEAFTHQNTEVVPWNLTHKFLDIG